MHTGAYEHSNTYMWMQHTQEVLVGGLLDPAGTALRRVMVVLGGPLNKAGLV